MTDWSVETLERIGKELPIKILTDYMKKYKKLLKLAGEIETKIDDGCDLR
jgi:hypothetical protein